MCSLQVNQSEVVNLEDRAVGLHDSLFEHDLEHDLDKSTAEADDHQPHAPQTRRRVSWTRTVTGFVGRNWQCLSTAILIPLIGWIWHTRRRSPPASA